MLFPHQLLFYFQHDKIAKLFCALPNTVNNHKLLWYSNFLYFVFTWIAIFCCRKTKIHLKNKIYFLFLFHCINQNCSKQTRICKTMFLRLHGVSNGRLDRILQAVNCQMPDALQVGWLVQQDSEESLYVMYALGVKKKETKSAVWL